MLLHDSDCESYPGSWKSALGTLPLLADTLAEARASRSVRSATTGSRSDEAGARRLRPVSDTSIAILLAIAAGFTYALASVLQQGHRSRSSRTRRSR